MEGKKWFTICLKSHKSEPRWNVLLLYILEVLIINLKKTINNILINYLIITSLTVVNVKGNTKGGEQ
jgi:hypothetical protein